MKVFHLNVSSVIAKAVGIPFSSYWFIPSGIVVGLETFMQLANIPFVDEVPYATLKIKLVNENQAKKVANMLRSDILARKAKEEVWEFTDMR